MKTQFTVNVTGLVSTKPAVLVIDLWEIVSFIIGWTVIGVAIDYVFYSATLDPVVVFLWPALMIVALLKLLGYIIIGFLVVLAVALILGR